MPLLPKTKGGDDGGRSRRMNSPANGSSSSSSSSYQSSLQRLADYREKLFCELTPPPSSSGEAEDHQQQKQQQKYAQFVAHFQETITEAKANLELLKAQQQKSDKDGGLSSLGSLISGDHNDLLLPRLISSEQLLGLYRLLKQVADQSASLGPLHDALRLEHRQKQLPIDGLLGGVASLRRAYLQMVSCLNVLIRGGISTTATTSSSSSMENSSSSSSTESPVFQYVFEQCSHWQARLLDLFQELFIASFEAVQWPTVALVAEAEETNTGKLRTGASSVVLQKQKEELKAKQRRLFVELFRALLELQTGEFKGGLEEEGVDDDSSIPENLLPTLEIFSSAVKVKGDEVKSGLAPPFLLHLPIKLMAVPLVKRFNYHFLTEQSKLNSIENPEWYLCQVEQWITRNEPFLSRTVDPILEEYFGEAENVKSAKFQLTCHLLELVKAKLRHDVATSSALEEDDRLFSHTLDEVIIFNKQVNYLVPGIFEARPSLNPMAVLFNEEEALFQRFLRLEKDRLNELVDSIFQSETSWTVVYGGGDNSIIEEEESTSDPSSPSNEPRQLIVCEAADRFSLLLLNLIDRSTYIPLSRYRLRIIHLLIDTVDDFCLRLSQVVHVYEERWPFTRKFYSLLNTFGYLLTLVGEWQNGGGSYFMQTLTENGQDLSVFSPTARTLQHMIEEIFERIENNIIADVTLDIIEYKKLNWHGMKLNIGEDEQHQHQQHQPSSLSISQAGATLVYHISMQLAALKRALSTDLFHSFLYDVAEKVQRLFFERIILEHYFNHDGARQLQYDIEKGLLAIFALYLKNTEYTFSRLTDALLLLNCSPTTAAHLETLYKEWLCSLSSSSSSSSEAPSKEMEFKQALQRQLGVYSLKPQTAYQLLRKRV